jgi:hypothetical protein
MGALDASNAFGLVTAVNKAFREWVGTYFVKTSAGFADTGASYGIAIPLCQALRAPRSAAVASLRGQGPS